MERADYAQRSQALERSLSELQELGAAQAEAFERSLAREAEARAELERVLGRDLREQIALEAERVHSAVMREMRERIDGQKSLRDEVQFQQQTMTRLSSRVDEAFVLSQEHACQKVEVEKLQALQLAMQARLEAAEQGIVEEASARGRSEKALGEDIRKLVTADIVHARTQIAELLQRLDEVRAETFAANSKVEATQESVEKLVQQAAHTENSLRQCGEELKAVRKDATQEVSDLQRRTAESEADVRSLLDSRLLESEAGLRGWVNSSVAARLTALEGAVRPHPPEVIVAARTARERTPIAMAPVQVPANWVTQSRPVTTFISPG